MGVYKLEALFLTPIFNRDGNGQLVLLLSNCLLSCIMKVDETKSDYFSDGVSCTYTFNSFNLYFSMLICSFIVYFIYLNDAKSDEVNNSCKGITGVAVSENQEVYYSITISNKNYLYQNYISTSIFKANSNLQSSECNPFSKSFEGNKIKNWKHDFK